MSDDCYMSFNHRRLIKLINKRLINGCLSGLCAAVLAACAAFGPCPPVLADTDPTILTDPVINTYTGTAAAAAAISNLDFKDVPASHWAKEPITRAGALNIIKGESRNYSPDAPATAEQVIAVAMRAVGQEQNAQSMAGALAASAPAGSDLPAVWSLGYLNTAMQMGVITPAQYADALAPAQNNPAPGAFVRSAPASREDAAYWLYTALTAKNPNIFPQSPTQAIYSYADWAAISPRSAAAVEALLAGGVMKGSGGKFNPKSTLSRAELAQIISNMDDLYYGANGITKASGTVAAVRDGAALRTGAAANTRSIYVRRADGGVDLITAGSAYDPPRVSKTDAVTYKDGAVTGLYSLAEGDRIQYLTNDADNTVIYADVTASAAGGSARKRTVAGTLVSLGGSSLTIQDPGGARLTFPLRAGLINAGGISVDGVLVPADSLPIGGSVSVTLTDGVIDSVHYTGQPAPVQELRGIVTENNPDLGYLTFVDQNGNAVTKYYNADIPVTKAPYYGSGLSDASSAADIADQFPGFALSSGSTSINDIEPGDIIFLRPDTANPDEIDTIAAASAASNYTARYGSVRQIRRDTGGGLSSLLLTYENGEEVWLDVAEAVPVSRNGSAADFSDIVTGDHVRVLVNEAVIEPGYTIGSAKEIALESGAHLITDIVMGQLSSIDGIQRTVTVQNAQTLTDAGWSDYRNLRAFNLPPSNLRIYKDGAAITADYAARFLKRGAQMYVALENGGINGQQARVISFRASRDSLLPPDIIAYADGNGGFAMPDGTEIGADPGTIVVKDGRLVDRASISTSDYATVALNGQANGQVTAAVVDIARSPDVSGVIIARGRVRSVRDGQSFTVSGDSILNAASGGINWQYSPANRTFATDYDTLFLNASGYADPGAFIGYTPNSVLDKTFTIVIDGARAARVIDAPFAASAVRGTVYDGGAPGVIALRDVTYYDGPTGRWTPISLQNATAAVTIPANSVIVKRNAVAGSGDIRPGDQVTALTDGLPDKKTGGMSVTGYIVLVK